MKNIQAVTMIKVACIPLFKIKLNIVVNSMKTRGKENVQDSEDERNKTCFC